jgi:hypothetical protein
MIDIYPREMYFLPAEYPYGIRGDMTIQHRTINGKGKVGRLNDHKRTSSKDTV